MVKKIPLMKYKLKYKILQSLKKNKIVSTPNDTKQETKTDKPQKQKLNAKGLCIKDHYYTFQQKIELFTLLYTTIVFKWIQTDRVRI